MSKRSLILDCDPGLDDTIALALGLQASEHFELMALTTVAGNVGLDQVTENARRVLHLAGRSDIPVYAGCSRQLVETGIERAAHIHGDNGIAGLELPASPAPYPKTHAVDYIIEAARAADDGSLTIATIGPMTNLAMALIKAPDIAAKFAQHIFMGGAVTRPGNVTPAAEFNLWADPFAARVVLDVPIPRVMIGLDVTMKALVKRSWFEEFKTLGNPVSDALSSMIDFYGEAVKNKYGEDCMGALHDVCCIAFLMKPEIFGSQPMHVHVETTSERAMGKSIGDVYSVTGLEPNMDVVLDIDAGAFFDLLREHIARYGNID